MENVDASSILNDTSSDPSFPQINAYDKNRNTTWRAINELSSFAGGIDLGVPKQVDAFIAHIRNYTLHGHDVPANGVDMNLSDDNITYTYMGGFPDWYDQTKPLRVYELPAIYTAAPHRYWQYGFYTPDGSWVQARIGLFAPARLWEIGHQYQLPSRERRKIPADIIISKNDNIIANNYTSKTNRILDRKYVCIGQAELDVIIGAFEDSHHKRFPLILVEGSNDPIMVKFNISDLDIKIISSGFWEVSLQFIEVPYIDSEKSY